MTGKMTPKEMEELTKKILAGGEPGGAQPAPGGPGAGTSSEGTVFEPVEKYFETHGIEDPGGQDTGGDTAPPPVQPKQEQAGKPPETKQNPPPDNVDDPDSPEKQLELKGDGPLPVEDEEEVTNEEYLPEDAETPPEAYEDINPQKVDTGSMESKPVPDKPWGKGDIDYGPEKEDGANEPGEVQHDFGSSTGPGVTDPASEPLDALQGKEKPKTPWGKGDIDFGPDHEKPVEKPKDGMPPNFGSPTGPGVAQPGPQHEHGSGGGSFFQDLGEIGLGAGMAGTGGDGPASGGFGKDKLKDLIDGVTKLPDPTKPDF